MDQPIIPTTIFSPIPLLQIRFKNQNNNLSIALFKKYSIPLTACFYYSIQNNNIMTDIQQHPYTTIFFIYAISYYISFMAKQKSQKKIDEEIINIMEHIFQILIIGHGIYNKIVIKDLYKNSLNTQESTLFTTLEEVLYNTYHSWLILFDYYEEHYQKKSLYTYKMNQIDLFEMIQACDQEPDLLTLITDFYKDETYYNYEPILNFLEIKLKLINYKISENLSDDFHNKLGK